MKFVARELLNLAHLTGFRPVIETIETQSMTLLWDIRHQKTRNNLSMIDFWIMKQSPFAHLTDVQIQPTLKTDRWLIWIMSNRMQSNSHQVSKTIQASWATMECWSLTPTGATFSISIKSKCSCSHNVLSYYQRKSSSQGKGLPPQWRHMSHRNKVL